MMTANGKRCDMLEQLHNAFNAAKMNNEIADNVFVDIWQKAGFNAAINSTTAVCRGPCGAIGRVEEGRELAFNIAREVAKVANAHGIRASADAIIKNLEKTFVVHELHFTSMAQDVLNRRLTEVQAINGAIVNKAKEVGINVPYTESLFALIRVIEQTYDLQAGH